MFLTGFDTETTGADIKVDRVTEVGACTFDSDSWRLLSSYSAVITPDELDNEQREISPEASEVSGITDELRLKKGCAAARVIEDMVEMVAESDVIFTYNGTEFDRPLFVRELLCGGISQKWINDNFCRVVWVDGITDFPMPAKLTKRKIKLDYLAAEHGFLNPFPHQALSDSMTLMRIAQQYDLTTILEMAKMPSVKLQAVCHYMDREDAKQNGFYWDAERKIWHKTVKKNLLQAELERSADFKYDPKVLDTITSQYISQPL